MIYYKTFSNTNINLQFQPPEATHAQTCAENLKNAWLNKCVKKGNRYQVSNKQGKAQLTHKTVAVSDHANNKNHRVQNNFKDKYKN